VLVGLTGSGVFGVGSPSSKKSHLLCGVWRWVEHRDWLMACLAHCWVLRGHSALWGVSSGPWPGLPNAPVVGVVVVGVGWGVVVC
jgi:hypothetical protein